MHLTHSFLRGVALWPVITKKYRAAGGTGGMEMPSGVMHAWMANRLACGPKLAAAVQIRV